MSTITVSQMARRFGAVVVVGLIAVGCGSDDDGQSQATQPDQAATVTATRTYVRDIPKEDISQNKPLIALVVTDAGGADQAVTAYACDGTGLWALFPETATGADFKLSSTEGSHVVQGTITETEVTGTLTLDGAKPVSFTAPASATVGNLYDVTVGADLSFTGVAADGDSFTGRLTEIHDSIPDHFQSSPFPVYRADVQFTSGTSATGAVIAPLYSGAVPNELFVIANDRGEALGGPKTKAGRGTFFTWRMID